MKKTLILLALVSSLPLIGLAIQANGVRELYTSPEPDVRTRWVSPENPTGAKGHGGKTNLGAKGNAFYIIPPGTHKTIMKVDGAGIIQRMWMSGTIAKNPEQRRAVRIDMYWDGSDKPAVSAPVGDFFGSGLAVLRPFDSELFSSPEGRSFNFTIPMPFRSEAKIVITNESSSQVLFWFDINLLKMDELPQDALYFHSYWSREPQTTLGIDFEILPKVRGKGRYLGTNIGVIGDPGYLGTWFGEGEVKIYLDGDEQQPTLQGTGTEDYVGTGWGQGVYAAQRFGSLVSEPELDLYAFYRYHTADAVYFHNDRRVTIQQMGSASREQLREMRKNGMAIQPVWHLETYGQNILKAHGKPLEHVRLLEMESPPDLFSDQFPAGPSTNYFREDDVSATAYFYLDRPTSELPDLAPVKLRLKSMQDRVWSQIQAH